jgi:catechol 2,3-dioxygenase-like lactoylglutathione lyase family enzyme
VNNSPAVATDGVLHACIAVADLDAGIDWYGRILGFQSYQRHDYPEYGVRVVYLRLRDIELELVETANPKPCRRDDPPAGHVALRGISQLSFRVTNMESTVKRLQSLDVAIDFGPLHAPEFNLKACFIRDHEENLIEFIERL